MSKLEEEARTLANALLDQVIEDQKRYSNEKVRNRFVAFFKQDAMRLASHTAQESRGEEQLRSELLAANKEAMGLVTLLTVVFNCWQQYKKAKYMMYEKQGEFSTFAMEHMPASEGALEDACCIALGLTWRANEAPIDMGTANQIIKEFLAACKKPPAYERYGGILPPAPPVPQTVNVEEER